MIRYSNLYSENKIILQRILKGVTKNIKNSTYILKDDVSIFEKNICKYLNVKYCVGLNSGTDALLLALSQLNLKKGDEVITTPLTYVATISAILHVGAKPIFVDIADDFNIDVLQIEKKITKKTKCILPVHLFGRCCDMQKINNIAKKYNLSVIEDSAQSFGSKINNRFSGTFGNIGCFSLHPMKTLNVLGDGGFIVTNNRKYASKIKTLRDHGRLKKKNKSLYLHYGFNSRLDNIQAAIANIKLKSINKLINNRIRNANLYKKFLCKDRKIRIPFFKHKLNFYDTFNSFVILSRKKKEIIYKLKSNGVEVLEDLTQCITLEKNLFSNKKVQMKRAEYFFKNCIYLPINPFLKEKEIKFICNHIVTAISE
tara:strand:+ start:19444 stop:20553 length:1110 start_codon:yes stop_codon:yes gene_type:complete